jgi:hypothetical protein
VSCPCLLLQGMPPRASCRSHEAGFARCRGANQRVNSSICPRPAEATIRCRVVGGGGRTAFRPALSPYRVVRQLRSR